MTGAFNLVKDFASKMDKIFNHCLKPDLKSLVIPFPLFPYLQLRIIPGIFMETHLGLDFQVEDTHIGFNLYARAEVSISFEVGIYIPPQGDNVLEISLSVGLKGILDSGKAGIKLYLRFRTKKIITDLYWEFNSFTINFNVKLRIKINLKFLTIPPFEIYIINKHLVGFYKEYHRESTYNFKGYYINSMGDSPYSILESNEDTIKNI